MQIHRLALKNFKCFKEVDISFSKITLLTGENSSGKSSLIYGILVPLQSINFNNDKSFPLYLSLNGRYVNVGGFEEVSFRHNLKNYLGIELDFYFSDTEFHCLSTSWYFDILSKSPKLNYSKIINRTYQTEIKREDLSYNINSNYTNKENSKKDLINVRIKDIDRLEQYYEHGFNEYYSVTVYQDLDEAFNFISSFRLHPDRTYYQSITSNKVDRFGSGYIDQVLDWNDRQSEELYELVSILKDLKMIYDIKPHRLSGGRFEIKVKVKSGSKWESLADVGFGISQFLPIIVADLQLRDDSTLIMSQPEIHLHPSIQANLGDYLVKQVNERNKNYIVETHSEYLLNRMRLLIVKGEIQPEDVAVYYFENSIKNGSIAHRIEFTKDGQILNAPKGFFETYMIDTMDIALNA
jgi:predicted ATPase